MPSTERRKLVDALLSLEEEAPIYRQQTTKLIKWPDVQARARRIFGERKLPNLVLMEREEETC